MESNNPAPSASPATVALLGWLLPGSGYLLIGQRGRAIVIGTTILVLFVMGLLIGGVRVIEVPGYDVNTGERAIVTVQVPAVDPGTKKQGYTLVKEWALDSPLNEIRDKPWSVPQALTGPIAIAAGAWSVHSAEEDPDAPKVDPGTGLPIPAADRSYGALSHSRTNEIGSLYLSVAGLLNLMAIIDSAWRASQLNEQRREPA